MEPTNDSSCSPQRVIDFGSESPARTVSANGDGDNAKVVMQGHTGVVRCVAFSPDGVRIASGSEDNMLRVWDVDGSAAIILRGHNKAVVGVAFSPDGRLLASGSLDGVVRIWDAISGMCLGLLEGHSSAVRGVAFSPADNGLRLASASLDRTVRIWQLRASLVRTADDSSASEDEDAGSGTEGSAFSAGLNALAVSSDLYAGSLVRVLSGHQGGVLCVAYSPDGQQIASGSADNKVRVWASATGAVAHDIGGHEGPVTAVAFTADGCEVVSGSEDGTVRMWYLADGASGGFPGPIMESHSAAVTGLAVCFATRTIISCSVDETVRVWFHGLGKLGPVYRKEGTGTFYGVSVEATGRLVAIACKDRAVRVWDCGKSSSRPRELPRQKSKRIRQDSHRSDSQEETAAADQPQPQAQAQAQSLPSQQSQQSQQSPPAQLGGKQLSERSATLSSPQQQGFELDLDDLRPSSPSSRAQQRDVEELDAAAFTSARFALERAASKVSVDVDVSPQLRVPLRRDDSVATVTTQMDDTSPRPTMSDIGSPTPVGTSGSGSGSGSGAGGAAAAAAYRRSDSRATVMQQLGEEPRRDVGVTESSAEVTDEELDEMRRKKQQQQQRVPGISTSDDVEPDIEGDLEAEAEAARSASAVPVQFSADEPPFRESISIRPEKFGRHRPSELTTLDKAKLILSQQNECIVMEFKANATYARYYLTPAQVTSHIRDVVRQEGVFNAPPGVEPRRDSKTRRPLLSQRASTLDPEKQDTRRYRSNLLHSRDIRKLDNSLSQSSESVILVRQHVILVRIDPMRAVILKDRCLFIFPVGADDELAIIMDRLSKPYDPIHKDEEMKFEFKVMEVILETLIWKIDKEFDILEQQVKDILTAVQKLSTTSTSAVLENLRVLKNKLGQIKSRTMGIYRATESILDEDEHVLCMNLTRIGEDPSLLTKSIEELDDLNNEPEQLLETYLHDLGRINGQIEQLQRNISNAESLMTFKMNFARNSMLMA